MAVKHKILIAALITLAILNIYYYRKYIVEAWMWFKVVHQPIVISLTTTPHRIAHMQASLQTILDQNLTVPIYLSIPYHFKRDNMPYHIPAWILDNPRITILRTKDYGPATKLLGLLEKVDLDPDTIIISLDDDIHYPKNLVLQLAYKALQNPHSAVGMVGANLDYDADGNIAADSVLGFQEIDRADAQVDVLKGYGGVAYRRKFFTPELFTLVTTPNPCNKADDIIFSYTLAAQNIPKIMLKNSYINQWQIRWQSEISMDEHALCNLKPSPVEKHRLCLAYLHQLNPAVKF